MGIKASNFSAQKNYRGAEAISTPREGIWVALGSYNPSREWEGTATQERSAAVTLPDRERQGGFSACCSEVAWLWWFRKATAEHTENRQHESYL